MREEQLLPEGNGPLDLSPPWFHRTRNDLQELEAVQYLVHRAFRLFFGLLLLLLCVYR